MGTPHSQRCIGQNEPMSITASYPRLAARTQNFRLGAPRSFTIAPDGSRVVFVRSHSSTDTANNLYVYDVQAKEERVLVDPKTLAAGAEQLTQEERARRERMRETTSGVTAYSTDSAVTKAAFAHSGELFVTDLITGHTTNISMNGSVIDPRMSPDGQKIAFVANNGVHVADIASKTITTLATPESDTVTYGIANFIAAEELERHRGHWWSPDSTKVLVERVDNAPVQIWHIADPAHPENEPYSHRYPQAGTNNPDVTLQILGVDGSKTNVTWDTEAFEYLVTASWQKDHDPLITVMNRSQKKQLVLSINSDGTTRTEHERTDPNWVEWITGLPQWHGGTLLVHKDDHDLDTRVITKFHNGKEEVITPAGLQIDALLDVQGETLVVQGTYDSAALGIYAVHDKKATPLFASNSEYTVATVEGDLAVIQKNTLDSTKTDVFLTTKDERLHTFTNLQAQPQDAGTDPAPQIVELTDRKLKVAVLFPKNHTPGTKLPVLMNPYGGPHHLEVIHAKRVYAEDQFIADQGFAVVIIDGSGTPMRGPKWDREVHNDFVSTVINDQVNGLAAAGQQFPDLDLTRVGIKGWSFGGFLSALAVLERPDVFHVGIAGAPVTDFRLYDTGYTERYLGDPNENFHSYMECDLNDKAGQLTRPLMIIHGLADDNVVAAHSLKLSGALTAAGKPHTFLPLSGVTHMTPQETIAENLLLLQIDFLKQHLFKN